MPFVYKITLTYFEVASSQTLQSSSGSHDWIGRPNFAIREDGVWVMAYRSGIHHGPIAPLSGQVHIRFSNNEGISWSDEDKTLAGAAVTGFPLVGHSKDATEGTIVQAANGDLLIAVLEDEDGVRGGGTWIWRSTDDGASWSSVGQMESDDELLCGGQIIVIGTDLYMILWTDPGSNYSSPYSVELHKSTDHGATWSLVSEVIGTGTDANESAIVHTGGNNLLVIARSTSETMTFKAVSNDLGNSWTVTDVTSQLGVVQRPKLKYLGDRLYLFGRNRLAETSQRTGLWWSDDDGNSWDGPFLPNSTIFNDCGYCDMLPRANGELYLVTYEGTSDVASLVAYEIAVIQ